MKTEQAVSGPVEGPLVGTIKPHVQANTVGNGRTDEFGFKRSPLMRCAAGCTYRAKLSHVGRLLEHMAPVVGDVRPRQTSVRAELQLRVGGLRTVDIEDREAASNLVGVREHRPGAADNTVRPAARLNRPTFCSRVRVKRHGDVAVQRPAPDLRRTAVSSLFHVNPELQQRVLGNIDHSEVHPGCRDSFKARYGNVGGCVEDLPLKFRARIDQRIHVKQTVQQVLSTTEKGGAKHLGGPVSFTAPGAPVGCDDDVVHPRRV